jgi:hypothetical protein
MLFTIGRNWTKDLSDQERNGTFLIKTPDGIEVRHDIKPTYISIAAAINDLIK